MSIHSGQRILLIDNNTEAHKELITILTNASFRKSEQPPSFQFQIDTSSYEEEFIQRISEASRDGHPYALIFLNLSLFQGLDGIEMIKHICSIDPDIQLVICTSHLDDSWDETVTNLEKNDNLIILKKPYDPITVRQLAHILAKKWQLKKESCQYAQQVSDKNKTILRENLNQEISKSRNNNLIFGVLTLEFNILNLNQNDLNEEAANLLLRSITNRIQSTAHITDEIIQVDRNKFTGLLSSCKSLDVLKLLAEKIAGNLGKPFVIMGQEITISPSIGISIFPKDGNTADELIENADLALHNQKELHGKKLNFYKSNLNKNNIEPLKMEADLHNALANNELFICYQPQYDTSKNKYTSVEALIRWKHPKKGVLLPMNFIPLAEETGLIVPIGEWLIREVCIQNKAWQDLSLTPIRVAVNISESQFKQHDFLATLKNILKETRLDPEYLELELDENTLINNPDSATLISQLHTAGMYITLDDFSASTANDDYTRSIPLDQLKISRSFVQNIGIKLSDEETILAIAQLAKNLNLEIIAEGVETQKQLEFLQAIHCKNIQGFYFNKPLSPHEIENLLRNPAKIELSSSSSALRLA